MKEYHTLLFFPRETKRKSCHHWEKSAPQKDKILYDKGSFEEQSFFKDTRTINSDHQPQPNNKEQQMSIAWAYMRKGWVSCKKAWTVFADNNLEIEQEQNASKETISGDEVWDLLKDAPEIHVASGKKIIDYNSKTADKEELLKKVTGRTGNLRAPALRIGKKYYIGFNETLYEQIASLK